MRTYDEDRLCHRLISLAEPWSIAFSAMCADALVRTYPSFAPSAGLMAVPLDSLVGRCWSAFRGGAMEEVDIRADLNMLDDLLSEAEDDLGIGEHVIAGIYYALECAAGAGPVHAELVAKSLYEGADYSVILDSEASGNDLTADEILGSLKVQKCLELIWDGLALVESLAHEAGDVDTIVHQLRDFVRAGV